MLPFDIYRQNVNRFCENSAQMFASFTMEHNRGLFRSLYLIGIAYGDLQICIYTTKEIIAYLINTGSSFIYQTGEETRGRKKSEWKVLYISIFFNNKKRRKMPPSSLFTAVKRFKKMPLSLINFDKKWPENQVINFAWP